MAGFIRNRPVVTWPGLMAFTVVACAAVIATDRLVIRKRKI